MNIENIILFLVVAASLFYLLRRIRNSMKHDGSHSGCSECMKADTNKKSASKESGFIEP